jgi:hypothetical protein
MAKLLLESPHSFMFIEPAFIAGFGIGIDLATMDSKRGTVRVALVVYRRSKGFTYGISSKAVR